MFTNSVLILGALINFIGTISYIRATLRGQAKPNRVTWGLWTVAASIAFAAQIDEGVGMQALLTFTAGFCPFLVLVASFIGKQAKWKLTKFDIACGVLAVVGLVVWQLMDNALYALIFAIAADLAAGLPTVYKSMRYPETEDYVAFATAALSAVLTLSVATNWGFISIGFAVYLFVITAFNAVMIRFKLAKHFFPPSNVADAA